MAYSDFNITKVRETFALTVEEPADLFSAINPESPSQYLQTTLSENVTRANAINTEKARSELIIAGCE